MIIDFETYSAAGFLEGTNTPLVPKKPGLKGVGLDVYASHPSTDIICLYYGDKLWRPSSPTLPEDLFEYARKGGTLHSHNSMFEFRIWNGPGVKKYGFPPVPLEQFECTAARSRNYGLPGALAKIGEALRLPIRKDPEGDKLIKWLSVPQKGGKRSYDPARLAAMYKYCAQDVLAEQCVYDHTPDMRPEELEVWQLDQQINYRGVHIDMPTLRNLKRMAQMAYDAEVMRLISITQGQITSTSQVDAIAKFCGMKSVDAETVEVALANPKLPALYREVLEIRQRASGAAARKLWAIEAQVGSDDRLRDLYIYAGAERTGRWSGVGPQPQNLKAGGPDYHLCTDCMRPSVSSGKCPSCGATMGLDVHEWGLGAMEAVYEDAKTLTLDQMTKVWGDVITVIGSSIRGLFIAASGHQLISSDYSAIEAVVLACLAGEQWRIEVFRTHGKIYEASAAKSANIPLESILEYKKLHGKHHPVRMRGKTRELANGYAGWIGSNRAFGATGSDDEIKADILQWREESPRIVEFWGGQWRKHPLKWEFYPERYGLEGAAVNALENPYKWFNVGYVGYYYDKEKQVLLCGLPSGRRLVYHYPRLVESRNRLCQEPEWKIVFKGYDTDSKHGPPGWKDIETYAGKLTNNVVQGTANDILRDAMVRLNEARYKLVLHTHDEVVAECQEGFGSVEELERIMSTLPVWAQGWPIKAKGGWEGRRYRK